MSIFGFNLDNQTTLYMMVILMVVFTLVSGILAYYSLKMSHVRHGHDEEDHD